MAMVGVVIMLLILLAPSFLAVVADVFCDNLKVVAATLPSKTSSSSVHMGTHTFGQAPDVVYARALCRHGFLNDDTACGNCLTNVFEIVLNATPPQQEQCYKAGYYYGDCQLVYSDHILEPSGGGSVVDDKLSKTWNRENVTGDGKEVSVITDLIQELLVETMEKAAASATPPIRFATGALDTGTAAFPRVYSLAQCMTDLSASDCLSCLHLLLDQINSTMSLRIGGRLAFRQCYFRYDMYMFYYGEPMLLLLGPQSAPAPALTPTKGATHKSGGIIKLWAIIPIAVAPLAAAAFLSYIFYRRNRRLTGKQNGKVVTLLQQSKSSPDSEGDELLVWQGKNSDLSIFGFQQLLEATNNFAEENKLGQGGFGTVYKGQLPEGLWIAVKRLACHSGQGFMEFKNEVQFISKLQHKNLVKLLGCCSKGLEKILVYEYLPNKSLDFFIFDENRRALLDWSKLVAIIEGIAHGLVYLHKHSRLRVIHRDLKPSNILLDSEMNPKISDFGLAKILSSTNTDGNATKRVVGTYGYMAPEYASKGVFSIKSDVFSFGIVIFEILSGKRNSCNQRYGDFINLLGYAWKLWEDGKWNDLVDASFVPESDSKDIMRCINIALLCTQENASDRPTMSDVLTMLSSGTMILGEPKKPAYLNTRYGNEELSTGIEPCSINDMTISIMLPR